MASIASFSGLASGIDWQSMIDQIIQVESKPITLYQEQVTEAQTREGAWESFRSQVSSLETAAAGLADGSAFQVFNTSVSGTDASLTVSAGVGASSGSFQAQVLQLATNEKLGSDVFASRTSALGITGEFRVGGVAVQIDAADTLDDVVSAFNRANTGSGASGVVASVLYRGSGQYQMVLTSLSSGASGISLADGAGGALRALGLLDASTQVKSATSNGAMSDGLTSSSQAVATLMGLSDPPATALVTFAAGSANPFGVSIDLATMSLTEVAEAINTAAGVAGSLVTAAVVSETDADGNTLFRLDVDGATGFTDANGILETLGILEGGRGDVAQVLASAIALTDGDATTAADALTLLSDLWVDGAGAGVDPADTLTLSGTRGDGTTFSKTYTVGVGDTLNDLLAALNSATDGFGSGDRPATASIEEGRVVVTDGTGGSSRLALSIVAHNEGGGTLDFGSFGISEAGRAREIVKGVDAEIELDGSFLTRASNSVSDVIPGVTLSLTAVSAGPVTVQVSRDTEAVVESVRDLLESYNALTEWVSDQFGGAGAEEGAENRPLSGDGVLRQMRQTLRTAMQTELAAAVGGSLTRLSAVGIEVTREGVYELDEAAFTSALASDPEGVERLFGVFGSGSVSAIHYVGSSDETEAGDYSVEITQAATQGTVTGVGFGGAYVDDGTADTMTVRDLGTDSEYSVSLTNGMTLTEIVSALNTELAAPEVHQAQASEAMYSDGVGTPATDSTLLQDLHSFGGASLGVADGDLLTFSGTRADGTSFLSELVVTDVTTQTLGDLRSALADALGSSETVTWEGGLLTVTGREAGRSSLDLSVGSDNAGGGTLSFGAMATVTEGREAAAITASAAGGELNLIHGAYGSLAGLEVSFSAGGGDGTASLGVAAGTYAGVDVAGTLGGHAATGEGQILTGADGTGVEGLMIRYTGADTGAIGSIAFGRGVASAVEQAASFLLGSGPGTISGVLEGIDPQVQRLSDRIEELKTRLELRREELIKRFAAMEEALVLAQQQSQWIAAQFGALSSSSQER